MGAIIAFQAANSTVDYTFAIIFGIFALIGAVIALGAFLVNKDPSQWGKGLNNTSTTSSGGPSVNMSTMNNTSNYGGLGSSYSIFG